MLDSFKRWMKTEHDLCQEELSAYLDGQLESRERARVAKHLETCAQCRADLEALQQIVALVRQVPAVKPPRSFLLPDTAAVQQRRVQRQSPAYATLRLATVVATVLLVLVVSGDALLRYTLPVPGAPGASLQGEPTMLGLERPATFDEATGATLAAPQRVAEGPTAESQPEAGAAAAPAAGATSEVAVDPMAAGEAAPEATPLPPENQLAAGTKARPSHTSAVPAAPPAAPTEEPADVAAAPTPAPEMVLPTATPLPPTVTPVPPTTVPEPTATAVPPTATPVIPETVVAPPLRPAGRWPGQGLIEAIRPVLPLLELALATVTVVLLAITLWMWRRQRVT